MTGRGAFGHVASPATPNNDTIHGASFTNIAARATSGGRRPHQNKKGGSHRPVAMREPPDGEGTAGGFERTGGPNRA